jgi:hypothetical protein
MQVRKAVNLEVETDKKQIKICDMEACWQHRYKLHAFCNTFPVLGCEESMELS